MLAILARRGAFQKFAALASIAVVLSLLPSINSAQAINAAPVQVPSGWNWTDYGPELLDVSCSAPNNCVAVGEDGAVLRSPNTDDVPLAWTFIPLKLDPTIPANQIRLVGVSCSAISCLAISSPKSETTTYGTWVYRSTDGGKTWAAITQLPPIGTPKTMFGSAVACDPDAGATADAHNCTIVGATGGIWRSTDDGRHWAGIAVAGAPAGTLSFSKLACPDINVCVAVSGADSTATSAVIRGTTVTQLTNPIGMEYMALACDSPTRCVSAGGGGQYSILTINSKPTWGPLLKMRKATGPQVATVKALSCPITNTCVALDGDFHVLRTDSLGTPDTFWSMRPVQPIIGALTCELTYCIGVGKMAAWYASFDTGGIFGRVNEVAKFDVAVCSAALSPTCIAGGEMNVGRSITQGTLWSLPISDRGALNTKAIQCQSSKACQIFGQTETLATEDMEVFRPRYGPVQSAAGADAVSCVNDTLCVSPKESVVYTTFDGGVTMWSSNQMPKVRPMGITCLPGKTEPVTCFEASGTNILMGTMTRDPNTKLPHWFWRYTSADADGIIHAIGCSPDGSQCVAAGVDGEVLVSAPGDLTNWSNDFQLPVTLGPGEVRPIFDSVTCPATGFCMIGGLQGKTTIVASTVDNFATYSYDKFGTDADSPGIKGFSCETINRCLGVGSTALVGVRNPPVPPPAK